MSEAKQLRVRTANIMQYEEFLSEDKIKSVLENYKSIEKYAYIKHDKDIDENGVMKKPHFHIVLKLKTPVPLVQVAVWFGIATQYVEIPKGQNAFIQCVQYLTHESASQQAKNKHRYDDSEVKANFDFRQLIDEYEEKKLNSSIKGASKKDEIRKKVMLGELKLSEIEVDDYVKDLATLQKCRVEYLRKFAKLPPSRTNYFIRGGSGTGKTFSSRALAKALIDPNNTMRDEEVFFTTGQGGAMFQGYDGQPVIIFDDIRSWDLLNYYNKNAGAIFNLFDTVPSASEQNIKFGSVKLVHTISIVNSIQTFDEFSADICYRVKETGVNEPDKQMFRRFPIFLEIKEGGDYDLFVNKQFFNPDEPNYKLYQQHRNLGISFGLIKAQKIHGENSPKFIELRQKHFEEPIKKHNEVQQKFNVEVENVEDLQAEFDFVINETNKKVIEVADYEVVENVEDIDEEIEKLEERMRNLKLLKFQQKPKNWNDNF